MVLLPIKQKCLDKHVYVCSPILFILSRIEHNGVLSLLIILHVVHSRLGIKHDNPSLTILFDSKKCLSVNVLFEVVDDEMDLHYVILVITVQFVIAVVAIGGIEPTDDLMEVKIQNLTKDLLVIIITVIDLFFSGGGGGKGSISALDAWWQAFSHSGDGLTPTIVVK